MEAGIIVRKPDSNELIQAGICSWPIWTCEPSVFDWHYSEPETCYILEGQVTVQAGTQTVSFGPGDMVLFPAGLNCIWHVRQAVKKHYRFG